MAGEQIPRWFVGTIVTSSEWMVLFFHQMKKRDGDFRLKSSKEMIHFWYEQSLDRPTEMKEF